MSEPIIEYTSSNFDAVDRQIDEIAKRERSISNKIQIRNLRRLAYIAGGVMISFGILIILLAIAFRIAFPPPETIPTKPIPIEVDAYIDGRIVETYEKEGVLVSSKGVLIQGIMGIGGEKKGTLSLLDNTADLNVSDINNDVIAVINTHLDFETYKKMSDLGLKGIICGGIDYESLTKILLAAFFAFSRVGAKTTPIRRYDFKYGFPKIL